VAVDIRVVAGRVDARVDVADEGLCPVGQALVDPVRLPGARVVLQQVLVLVRERALIGQRPRVAERPLDGVAASRVVGSRRVVRRVGTGAVDPVPRVQRHDVAVGVVVEQGPEEARDVGAAVRCGRVVVVLVADVVHQRDDAVALALEVVGGKSVGPPDGTTIPVAWMYLRR
jgi:hypothetical protein